SRQTTTRNKTPTTLSLSLSPPLTHACTHGQAGANTATARRACIHTHTHTNIQHHIHSLYHSLSLSLSHTHTHTHTHIQHHILSLYPSFSLSLSHTHTHTHTHTQCQAVSSHPLCCTLCRPLIPTSPDRAAAVCVCDVCVCHPAYQPVWGPAGYVKDTNSSNIRVCLCVCVCVCVRVCGRVCESVSCGGVG